ncbi:helix-turn-helix domain-containing protein [Streptomyces sp. SID8352]|uniref:helix-turn-helix domain-containing protein n=1 Tax=Streptomyces sp. SID8352 TaxID=2690338 RepID=UPI001F171CC7|nr:helix-turn-helix domain-containing protein [Streptomyces sp. SID8352]
MDTIQNAFDQISATAADPDPATRAKQAAAILDRIPDLQKSLREIRRAAVLELRAAGASHADVAAALGVTRSRAQQIAEGQAGGTKKKAT